MKNAGQHSYEHECRIRDYYAAELERHRPNERLVARENSYAGTTVRADMRTIDRTNTVRLWEFKIHASYEALGQILVYVAMARRAEGYDPLIRGVIAAFDFLPELVDTVERLNLNIELVTLPRVLALAGRIPTNHSPVAIPVIPSFTSHSFSLDVNHQPAKRQEYPK
ncbi:hypothetical protein G7043_34860 [Lentzea sp. NEAU-D13]|uniref:Uncharacterized protein n=1 Tax=Lentzea alba TaxID=2714351 RepID=A0A7C9VVG5_9PSEU|nr:hypothetical protein [Lentzea alba]NGY64112.1 hypothetical protein [Lentzea alba]